MAAQESKHCLPGNAYVYDFGSQQVHSPNRAAEHLMCSRHYFRFMFSWKLHPTGVWGGGGRKANKIKLQ